MTFNMPVFEPSDEPVLLQAAYSPDGPAMLRGIIWFSRKSGATRNGRITLMVFGALVWFVLGKLIHEPIGWLAGAGLFVILSFIAFMQPRKGAERAVKSWREGSENSSLATWRVQVTQNSLKHSTESTCTVYRLSSIHKIEHNDDAVLVYVDGSKVLIIPSDGEFGRLNYESFTERLRRIYADARQTSEHGRDAGPGERD